MTISEYAKTLRNKKFGDLALTNNALIPFLLGALVILLLHFARKDWAAFATASMWAASCLISGAALGFLFGIPRVIQSSSERNKKSIDNGSAQAGTESPADDKRDDEQAAYRQQVNTNLVEISDWLTKIIVGLGLVNLRKIPELLDNAAETLSRGLQPSCSGALSCSDYAFSVATIVTFSVLGFFMGYLYTRLFLAGAFSRADRLSPAARDTEQFLTQVKEIVREESADSNTTEKADQQLSEGELIAAERVSKLARAQDGAATLEALLNLAREYDRVRVDMPANSVRTSRMGELLQSMRALAIAGNYQLPRFRNGASAGERLVAIAMLQVRPDPAYFGWLIDRITQEKPFVGFQAIEALHRAAIEPVMQYRDDLRNRLVQWLQTPDAARTLNMGNDRSELLKFVLKSLGIEA